MIETLRTLVADVLGVEPSRVSGNAGPATIENWDSLAHLSIFTAVEEKFGVRFAMSEIRDIDNFDSLAIALTALLEKK